MRSNPSVSITPSSQNATAGSTLMYTTNVTNNDSSACGSSIFDLTYSIPSAWSASFANSSLTISPASSQATTFSITSDVNATSGNYVFTNIATNNGAPSFSGNNTASYLVL